MMVTRVSIYRLDLARGLWSLSCCTLVCDSLDQRLNVVSVLPDDGRDQRRVVVARAQIAGTAQRAHDLRADHALAGVGCLVAERLPIDVELDDLEDEQRDEAPVAARHREIASQHLLKVREAQQARRLDRCDRASRSSGARGRARAAAARCSFPPVGSDSKPPGCRLRMSSWLSKKYRKSPRGPCNGVTLISHVNGVPSLRRSGMAVRETLPPAIAAFSEASVSSPAAARSSGAPRLTDELGERIARQALVRGIRVDDAQLGRSWHRQ